MTSPRIKRFKAVAARRQEGIVILQDIYDPHNAAAVLRTCDGFGIQKVCFIFEKQKRFNPKKIGKTASSSANKWLDYETYDSTKKCLASLKRRGYTVYAAVLDAKAKPLGKIKFDKTKTALMFGNEHLGLSQTAVDLSDERIYIPMQGFVQSLNLSVTAAICLYELTRQQARGKTNVNLPPKQQSKLVSSWSAR